MKLLTDQKVGGSSPSKRTKHLIRYKVNFMSSKRSRKWFSWLPGVLVAAVFAAGGVAVAVGGDGEGGVVTVDPVRGI